MPQVLMVGNGPPLNRGCEAIALGTREILDRTAPEAELVNLFVGTWRDPDSRLPSESGPSVVSRCLSSTPPPWSPRYWALRAARKAGGWGSEHILSGLWQRAFERDVAESAVVLQAGGDNYSFEGGLPVVHMGIDRRIKKLSSGQRAIVLWAASIGTSETAPKPNTRTLAHLREHMSLVLARDPVSLACLREAGLGERTHPMGDPAFLMKPDAPEDPDLLSQLPPDAVGINLSPLAGRYSGSGGSWLGRCIAIVEAILRAFDRPVVLIPHVTIHGHGDHELMQQVLENIRGDRSRVTLLPPSLSAPQTKWVIGRCRLLIAARTHATIAAFSSLVPTVSIAYSAKAAGLNEQLFGHRDSVTPVGGATAERVVAAARAVEERRDEIRAALAEQVPRVAALACEGGERLRQWLS